MDQIATLENQERGQYFEQASAINGLLSPQLIEKDFWVCWMLERLFSLDEFKGALTFKGGTSLSKIFDLIKRFSEDIDVSIERAYLGYGGDNEPENAVSKKGKNKRIKGLKKACQEVVATKLMPMLQTSVSAILSKNENLSWNLFLDPTDNDKQTIRFQYPQAVRDLNSYIEQSVKIEFGARSDHFPTVAGSATPYVYSELDIPALQGTGTLRVLAPERTFWEKATILHAEAHRPENKPMKPRQSRHYYDLCTMSEAPVFESSLQKIDLLNRVREHKIVFFSQKWASYDSATSGSLKLIPPDSRIAEIRSDYLAMAPMFFQNPSPPSFDEILEKLREAETKINAV